MGANSILLVESKSDTYILLKIQNKISNQFKNHFQTLYKEQLETILKLDYLYFEKRYFLVLLRFILDLFLFSLFNCFKF